MSVKVYIDGGIGGDGVLYVLPSDKADFRMRIFNTDGSEAEMCGNGIRCFARYLHDFGLTEKEEFTVETGAGILVPRLQLEAGKVTGVRVDMGEPVLEGEKIPVTGFGMNRVIEEDIEVKGKNYKMTCVSMGNPHCVIFVEDAEAFPIYDLGASFESHPAFPRKTNTEFVEVRDRQHVRMRVWERGAAVTLASVAISFAKRLGLSMRMSSVPSTSGWMRRSSFVSPTWTR